jgi:hypothetical protein
MRGSLDVIQRCRLGMVLMLRRQLAMAERERPRAHSRLTWPDRAWLALLAGTMPAERLAAMRLIVTPGRVGPGAGTGASVMSFPYPSATGPGAFTTHPSRRMPHMWPGSAGRPLVCLPGTDMPVNNSPGTPRQVWGARF